MSYNADFYNGVCCMQATLGRSMPASIVSINMVRASMSLVDG